MVHRVEKGRQERGQRVVVGPLGPLGRLGRLRCPVSGPSVQGGSPGVDGKVAIAISCV